MTTTIKAPNAEQRPHRKHSALRGILLLLLALTCLVALRYFNLAPPLLRSYDRHVSYSIFGESHSDAELFQPLFMRGLYYTRLPALSGQRYEWFLVNYSNQRVQRPHWPRPSAFGFLHIHRDQAFGIDLLQPKMEDTWRLSFAPEQVEFSNDTIHVRVTK